MGAADGVQWCWQGRLVQAEAKWAGFAMVSANHMWEFVWVRGIDHAGLLAWLPTVGNTAFLLEAGSHAPSVPRTAVT